MKCLSILSILCCFVLRIQAQETQYTVLFDFNKSDIPDTAMLQLVKLIHSNSIHRVLIEAHCDSVGSKAYNYNLSDQRANEVKRFLTTNGIDKSAIKTCIGYGKDKPVAFNVTEVERQLNRRAQVTFYLNEVLKPNTSLNDSTRMISKIDSIKFNTSTQSKNFKSIDTNNILKPIDIQRLNVGENIVLDNMYFWGGRHVLKFESYPELQGLIHLMLKHPTLEIQIEGHVCCTTYQPDGYDWDTDRNDLSVARASAIYRYLIEHGVEEHRLSFKGYGGTKKINIDESTEELRSKNRRVEIKIMKK